MSFCKLPHLPNYLHVGISAARFVALILANWSLMASFFRLGGSWGKQRQQKPLGSLLDASYCAGYLSSLSTWQGMVDQLTSDTLLILRAVCDGCVPQLCFSIFFWSVQRFSFLLLYTVIFPGLATATLPSTPLSMLSSPESSGEHSRRSYANKG